MPLYYLIEAKGGNRLKVSDGSAIANRKVMMRRGGQGSEGAPSAPTDGLGASLFTAIQEQLRLKLESANGPLTTYRVDSLQKPIEN